MKKNMQFSRTFFLRTLSVSAFLLATFMLLQAQGWERTYDFFDNEIFAQVLELPDGSFVLLNDQGVWASQQHETYLMQVDADGDVNWEKEVSNMVIGNRLIRKPDGDYYIVGMEIIDFAQTAAAALMQADAFGNFQEVDLYEFDPGYIYHFASDGLLNPDGTVMIGGYMDGNTAPSDLVTFFCQTNAAGDLIWSQTYDIEEGGQITDVFPASDGGYLLTGYVGGNGLFGDAAFHLAKTDASGTLLWHNSWNDPVPFTRTTQLTNGDLLYTGIDTLNNDIVALLSKIDQEGNVLQEKTLVAASFGASFTAASIVAINATADGGAVMTVSNTTGSVIVKLDAGLAVEWYQYFDTVIAQDNIQFHDVRQTQDGGYIACGSKGISQDKKGYVIRLDGQGQLYSNSITGIIFQDENGNCEQDAGEPGANHIVVQAALGGEVFYAISDADGNYMIDVPPGAFDVRMVPPNPYIQYCPGQTQVILVDPGEEATAHFGMQDTIECPLLETTLGSWSMRRCFENKYYGDVCNIGTSTAEDATLEILLDPYLEYVSSNLTLLSQNGQLLTFELGDMDPGDCLNFEIRFVVDCDVEPGLTHCSEAHAYPDTLCLPVDPEWDGASIVLDGACVNEDTIRFLLNNAGSGNMDDLAEFIVIEDHMVMFSEEFQLTSGEERVVQVEATGATYRLEADQRPGHPGQSMPSVTVEGCGLGQGLTISTGYVNMFPMDEADPWIDIDCRENTGSYDPNKKEAFPVGYLQDHLIEPNTDLEYVIHFQNTGTDTAFLVVIRDTLSPLLDPATIRPGASSHPYEFDLAGQGVAIFTFPDIMLPDSNVNEPLSHGFVSFRIAQQPDNPLGEDILNSAAIYFDFNAPIITNQTFHRLGEHFVMVEVDPGPGYGMPAVKVYPNPFAEQAWFEVEGLENRELELQVFDAAGRHVSRVTGTSPLLFARNGLPEGMYFFRVVHEGDLIGTGKMIVD